MLFLAQHNQLRRANDATEIPSHGNVSVHDSRESAPFSVPPLLVRQHDGLS